MWSKTFESCIRCGTTEVKHRARGFCQRCYNRYNESRQKTHIRLRGIAGEKLTKEYLEKEYIIREKSLGDIAKECACSRQYVYKKLKQYKMHIRDKETARGIALENKKLTYRGVDEYGQEINIQQTKLEIDAKFFSIWSKEMAYVLGIIYSDGNLLYDDKRNLAWITIAQKEPELLEKVKILMKCNMKLQHLPRKVYKSGIRGEIYLLRIHHRKVYNDLLKLGLSPNKSLTIGFPKIPPEHVRHFIRGCWDGDGSVYIEKKVNQIRASYVSGSLNFIQGMLNELEREGFKKRNIYEVTRKSTSYYFRVTGSECNKLYHYLYDDVPCAQYLERKYNIFYKHFQ